MTTKLPAAKEEPQATQMSGGYAEWSAAGGTRTDDHSIVGCVQDRARAVVTGYDYDSTSISLRFDRRSTPIRLQFDDAIRPFDDPRYDRRGLLLCVTLTAGCRLRHCDIQDLSKAVERQSNPMVCRGTRTHAGPNYAALKYFSARNSGLFGN